MKIPEFSDSIYSTKQIKLAALVGWVEERNPTLSFHCWDKQRVSELTQVHKVAEKFIQANYFEISARYRISEMLINW